MFSNEAFHAALYGKAGHLWKVCSCIKWLNDLPPLSKDLLHFVQEGHENLGKWLATASPEDLRALAAWRDRPNWMRPVDPKVMGLLTAASLAMIEAAEAAGEDVTKFSPGELAVRQLAALRHTPRTKIRSIIRSHLYGSHTGEALQKVLARKFKATRKGPGRPPKPK